MKTARAEEQKFDISRFSLPCVFMSWKMALAMQKIATLHDHLRFGSFWLHFFFQLPFNQFFCCFFFPPLYTVQTYSLDPFSSFFYFPPSYTVHTRHSTSSSRRRFWFTRRRARRAREKRRPPCMSAPLRYGDDRICMIRVVYVGCTSGVYFCLYINLADQTRICGLLQASQFCWYPIFFILAKNKKILTLMDGPTEKMTMYRKRYFEDDLVSGLRFLKCFGQWRRLSHTFACVRLLGWVFFPKFDFGQGEGSIYF